MIFYTVLLTLLQVSASFSTSDDTCSLYLAESSVRNGGWGVFAGKNFAHGERVGPPGLGIQITDPFLMRDFGALSEFIMNAGNVGGYNEASEVRSFLPGIAALANYHNVLSNVFEGGLTRSDSDRYGNPMAGSYTNYHNFSFIAGGNITQGQEIFTDGTVGWFEEANLPVKKDYARVDKIVSSLVAHQQKHPHLSEEHWIDILYRMRTEMIAGEAIVAQLIPKTLKELHGMKERGAASANFIPRDFEWIKATGYCLDSIQEGQSMIPGAGRGAFATRNLKAGSVVAPAPLVQFLNRSQLELPTTQNKASQLLLNYCFSHRHSDIVLCPTTHVTLINHNSVSPNAEIRWSKASVNRIDADLNYRVEDAERLRVTPGKKDSYNTRLAFEVVATKDIQQGEEIYLDYGPEWEAALFEHNRLWSPPTDDSYLSLHKLNDAASEPLIPSSELPRHYAYECKLEPLASERRIEVVDEEDYYSHPQVDPERWNVNMRKLYGENDFICWHPCFVSGVNDDGTYRADIWSKRTADRYRIRTIKNIPRGAIRLTDNAFMSDQHLSSTFRHYIPIPDHLFPFRWRHDYRTGSSIHLGARTKGIDLTLPENRHHQDEHEAMVREMKCGVYFAPSNIPNAGFGTYTGAALRGKGFIIGTSIPVVPVPNDFPRRWNGADYVWAGPTYNAEFETAGADGKLRTTDVLAVNDGALANSHQGLVNEFVEASVFEPMLDRCKDPGAGAFSDYVHYSFKSEFVLSSGEELFVNYGEKWFTGRDQFVDVPMSDDWDTANRIVSSIWTMSQLEGSELGSSATIDLVHSVKESVVKGHRTRMALSTIDSMEDIAHVIERNGTAQATMQVRSQAWLEENGRCLDHIYVRASSKSQAGQGAFARRFLKAGSTVISAPLMTTFGDDMFLINVTKSKGDKVGEINEKLLFLNYQFSHPRSSVYFFPISHAFMFNHDSERVNGGTRPNAELRWADWSKKSQYFLQKPLEDLMKEHYSTIAFDVIATRDINVDEEVFIDYGIEWETAWQDHVRNWKPPCAKGTKSSFEIKQMNNYKFNPDSHTWGEDHMTVCKATNVQGELIYLIKVDQEIPQDGSQRFSTDFNGITFDHPGFDYAEEGVGRLPCVVLGIFEEQLMFNIAYLLNVEQTKELLPHNPLGARTIKFRNKVPASEVEIINRPFRSDMHWKGAFRHPIKIPDEIFPEHWKDVIG